MTDEEQRVFNKIVLENAELKSKIHRPNENKKIATTLNQIKIELKSIPLNTKKVFDNDPKKKWSTTDTIIMFACIIILLAATIPQACTFLAKSDYSHYFSAVSPFATLVIGYLWGHKK